LKESGRNVSGKTGAVLTWIIHEICSKLMLGINFKTVVSIVSSKNQIGFYLVSTRFMISNVGFLKLFGFWRLSFVICSNSI